MEDIRPLIEFKSSMTMAAPWISTHPGEAFVWGDYFAIFQYSPITVEQMLEGLAGKPIARSAVQYLYALTVFYRQDRSPHGSTARPIISLGIETTVVEICKQQIRLAGGAEALSAYEDYLLAHNGEPPVCVGMFSGNGRYNLGEYLGNTTADECRNRLLSDMQSVLNLNGFPRQIGTIADARGHVETGVPRSELLRERRYFKPALFKSIAIFVLVATIACVTFVLISKLESRTSVTNSSELRNSNEPEVPFDPSRLVPAPEPQVLSDQEFLNPKIAKNSWEEAPLVDMAPQQLPLNGQIFITTSSFGLAPLGIKTAAGSDHYYVKLYPLGAKQAVLSFFVRSGHTVEILVPLGNYEMRYASGKTWYGPEQYQLFGSETVTIKADDIFTFRENANGYSGYTVELIMQTNGNLDTDPIPRSEF